MFKYETHIHTYEGSLCGKTKAADYVDLYKSLGYDGIIVTDHFYHGNTRPDASLSWCEYVDEFSSGYYNLKDAAKGKLDVFFGIEERFDKKDEFLIYGLDPEWYKRNPQLREAPRAEFLQCARAAGGFIIQAHPFRHRRYYNENAVYIYPSLADAFEVFNSCNLPRENALAYELAKKYSKYMTSGSDRHVNTDYIENHGGILLPEKAGSIEDIIAAIKAGKAKPIGLESIIDAEGDFEPKINIVL